MDQKIDKIYKELVISLDNLEFVVTERNNEGFVKLFNLDKISSFNKFIRLKADKKSLFVKYLLFYYDLISEVGYQVDLNAVSGKVSDSFNSLSSIINITNNLFEQCLQIIEVFEDDPDEVRRFRPIIKKYIDTTVLLTNKLIDFLLIINPFPNLEKGKAFFKDDIEKYIWLIDALGISIPDYEKKMKNILGKKGVISQNEFLAPILELALLHKKAITLDIDDQKRIGSDLLINKYLNMILGLDDLQNIEGSFEKREGLIDIKISGKGQKPFVAKGIFNINLDILIENINLFMKENNINYILKILVIAKKGYEDKSVIVVLDRNMVESNKEIVEKLTYESFI